MPAHMPHANIERHDFSAQIDAEAEDVETRRALFIQAMGTLPEANAKERETLLRWLAAALIEPSPFLAEMRKCVAELEDRIAVLELANAGETMMDGNCNSLGHCF